MRDYWMFTIQEVFLEEINEIYVLEETGIWDFYEVLYLKMNKLQK